jgi:hypothetical protein
MKRQILTMLLLSVATMSLAQTPTMDDVLNKRVTGDLESIQLDNGAILKIGDTITIGTATGSGRYNFLTQNAVCMGSTNYSSNVSCIDGYYSLGSTAGGSRVVVKEIRARFKKIAVIATHAQGFLYATRVLSISSAIDSGEIKINGFISSDEALLLLKKAKDKLDLGLITQDDFNKIKLDLSKFIK